jgi:hypothetical protein
MNHTPHCDQSAQQFNAKAAARVPPEFVRHLDNETLLIFGSRLPETACHDADVYWKIRNETNAIQRKLVNECNGVWKDPETGKTTLSKSNIEDVFGEEERP